jgi:hypothetical protein
MPVQAVFRDPLAEIADAPRLAVALRPVCISLFSIALLSFRIAVLYSSHLPASLRLYIII